MEANRKRSGGLLKGKLMPFYSAPKTASAAQYGGGTKVMKATQPTARPAASIVVAKSKSCQLGRRWEEVYGAGDESVDMKAAVYISTVLERLKLEHVNSERMNIQESQV